MEIWTQAKVSYGGKERWWRQRLDDAHVSQRMLQVTSFQLELPSSGPLERTSLTPAPEPRHQPPELLENIFDLEASRLWDMGTSTLGNSYRKPVLYCDLDIQRNFPPLSLICSQFAARKQLITIAPKQPSMAENLEQGCDAEKWLSHLYPSQASSSNALGSPSDPQRASSFSQHSSSKGSPQIPGGSRDHEWRRSTSLSAVRVLVWCCQSESGEFPKNRGCRSNHSAHPQQIFTSGPGMQPASPRSLTSRSHQVTHRAHWLKKSNYVNCFKPQAKWPLFFLLFLSFFLFHGTVLLLERRTGVNNWSSRGPWSVRSVLLKGKLPSLCWPWWDFS